MLDLVVKLTSLLVDPVLASCKTDWVTSLLLLAITVLGNICAVSEFDAASTVLSVVVAYLASLGVFIYLIDYFASIWLNEGRVKSYCKLLVLNYIHYIIGKSNSVV